MTIEEFEELITRAGFNPDEIDIEKLERQLRKKEIAEAEKHRLQRTINRNKKRTKKERAERTHQLCNIGGAALMFFPELGKLPSNALEEFFDFIHNDIQTKYEYSSLLNQYVYGGDTDG